MKCTIHNSEATGICAYCGRAMCGQCAKQPGLRMVCSESCALALAQTDKAMELVLKKSIQNAKASAYYSYLCAALSAGAAIGAWYYLPSPFLIWFTAGCSVVFVISGYYYTRSAR